MNISYGNAADHEPQNYADKKWLKEKKPVLALEDTVICPPFLAQLTHIAGND